MEKKQTAVEYYRRGILQLNVYIADHKIDVSEFESVEAELFEQAKQMEKEHITDSYIEGHSIYGESTNAEQYYNETYGKTKN
jgi:hypothetical protein